MAVCCTECSQFGGSGGLCGLARWPAAVRVVYCCGDGVVDAVSIRAGSCAALCGAQGAGSTLAAVLPEMHQIEGVEVVL